MFTPQPAPDRPPDPFRRLAASGQQVAVTGATGWFGRVTLDLLAAALGPEAFRSRVAVYASRSRRLVVAGVGDVAARPLAELEPAEVLLHYAFVTRTQIPDDERDAFVAANVAITARVLQTVRSGAVRRLLVTSSGAALRPDLDANPYGALKALDELAFPEACRRVGAACVVARVFNVAGAHMTQPDAYALGDLIRQVRAGGPVRIAATGAVVRSFAGVEEIVATAVGELLEDRGGCFETGGSQIVEIEELAALVRRVLGRDEVVIERRRDPRAPESVYLGDP
ncbi:MAG: NAD(P)-dependent oxidoreductase, partial [Solirubrobacteraceae bacterium]